VLYTAQCTSRAARPIVDSFNPPRPSPVLVQVKSVSEVDQIWIRVEYGKLAERDRVTGLGCL